MVSLDVIDESILPMVEKLVEDDIPNIRFNVAKTYGALIDTLKRLPATGTIYELEKAGTKDLTAAPKSLELITERILPSLEKLQKDDDVDVRYFATTAASQAPGANGGDPMNTSP